MKTPFDAERTRYIQLGCGPHPLPAPWENYDREVNIAHPLPFPDGSVAYLFAEHVIEHVPFAQGYAFLCEARRVLELGGVLRIAFPDVTRFLWQEEDVELFGDDETQRYLAFMRGLGQQGETVGDLFRFILTGSGHKAAWSEDTGLAALRAAGFAVVGACAYGDSEHPALLGIERHHFSVPKPVAIAETTILEAIK